MIPCTQGVSLWCFSLEISFSFFPSLLPSFLFPSSLIPFLPSFALGTKPQFSHKLGKCSNSERASAYFTSLFMQAKLLGLALNLFCSPSKALNSPPPCPSLPGSWDYRPVSLIYNLIYFLHFYRHNPDWGLRVTWKMWWTLPCKVQGIRRCLLPAGHGSKYSSIY